MSSVESKILKLDKAKFPSFIVRAKDAFKSISVYQLTLNERGVLRELCNLIERDVGWVELIVSSNEIVKSELETNFTDLADKFEKIYKFYVGKESDQPKLEQIENSALKCYLGLLRLMMLKESDFNNRLAWKQSRIVFNSTGDTFDEKVKYGKLKVFKQDILLGSFGNLTPDKFFEYLNRHFFLFFDRTKKSKNFISTFFKHDLRNLHKLRDGITGQDIEDFFDYHLGSRETFERFLQRNYYYSYIEYILKKEYVVLIKLSKVDPIITKFRCVLRISKCLHPKYLNREHHVDHTGVFQVTKKGAIVPNNRRSFTDYIVIIGSDNNEIFNCDIKIPGPQKDEILMALLFIVPNRMNLIDISLKYAVSIKFTKLKINSQTIFLLGKNSYFWIEECTGIKIKDQKKRTIAFHSFDGCESTKSLDFNLSHLGGGEEVSIGSGENCNLKIRHQDIKEVHVKVKLENNELFIIDESGGNSFYLLKSRKKIENKKASHPVNLDKAKAFRVHGYEFEYEDLSLRRKT